MEGYRKEGMERRREEGRKCAKLGMFPSFSPSFLPFSALKNVKVRPAGIERAKLAKWTQPAPYEANATTHRAAVLWSRALFLTPRYYRVSHFLDVRMCGILGF